MKTFLVFFVSLFFVLGAVSCTKEKIVEVTRVVEKPVQQTVIVDRPVEVTRVVERIVVATPTFPVPVPTPTATIVPTRTPSPTIDPSKGTITIRKSSDSPAGDVILYANAVTLARYEIKVLGDEPFRIESLSVGVDSSNDKIGKLRNGKLFVNGAQVGSTADLVASNASPSFTTYSLGSSFVAESGKPYVVEIRADIFDADGFNNVKLGDVFQVRLESSSRNGVGVISNTKISTPAADTLGNAVIVNAGSLIVSKYTAFPNSVYVLPRQGVKLAHFLLTANGPEAFTIKEILMDYEYGNASSVTIITPEIGNNIQQSKQTISATGNSWTVDETLQPGEVVDLIFWGSVGSDEFSTFSSLSIQVRGVTAISQMTKSGLGEDGLAKVRGQTITYGIGTFTVAKDGTSPSNAVIAGNQTATNAKFKFTSQNESFTLTELFLKLASGASAAVDSAILKDGSTVLATLPFGTNTDSDSNSVTDSVKFTGLTVAVPANSSKVLTVDLDLADVSTNFSTSGIALQLTVVEMTFLDSVGVKFVDDTPGVGRTNPSGNTQIVYRGYPLVTDDFSGLSGIFTNGSETEFYKWKVKAIGSDIALTQFKFAVAFTDVNVQDLKVDRFKLFRGSTDITSQVTIRNESGVSVESMSAGVSETSSPALYITWDDDKEEVVGVGEEVTFTLKGVPANFNSVSGSKDSVAFTLIADNDESADVRNFLARDATLNSYELGATAGLTTGIAADFIWSDISATGHNPDDDSYGSNDWHNGYLVEQLNLMSKAWSLP